MKSTNLVRWGALAAMASGALWVAGGLLHLAFPQDPPGALGSFLNYLGTAVFSAAYLGMLGGLAVLHARQMDRYGRLGRAGFFLGFAGTALALVGQATSGIFPHNGALGWLFNRTGGSILLLVMAHFVEGSIQYELGWIVMGVWLAVAIGLVVFDWKAWRAPAPAPATTPPPRPIPPSGAAPATPA